MDRIKNKHYIVLLIVLVGLSGCITEKPKGYNESGYPPSYFDHPKLGGLNKTYYIYETQGIDAAIAYLTRNPNRIIENDSIGVRISITENNETNIDTLRSIGIKVLDVVDATDIGGEIIVVAFLPISKIRDVGELQFVKAVYVESKPQLE